MFQTDKIIKILAALSVSVLAVFCIYFLSKKAPVESYVEKEPSYRHSLKIGKKVLRTYRSPAAIKNERLLKKNESSSNGANFTNDESSESSDGSVANSSQNISDNERTDRSSRPDYENNPDNAAFSKAPTRTDNTIAAKSGITGTQLPFGGPAVPNATTPPPTTTDDAGPANNTIAPSPVLKGKVKPLVGVVTNVDFNFLIESAYANTCSNPRILLFDLSNMSILLDNPLTDSIINGTTQFQFNPVSLGLNINTPSRYLLHTHGCATNYKRIVTSFFEPQDLDFVTTLISNIINTASSGTVSATTPKAIDDLYNSVGTAAGGSTDIEAIFDMIDQTPDLTDMFEDTFPGGVPTELTVAAPDFNSVTYSTSLVEKTGFNYILDASHWDSSYVIAYEWYVDGILQSYAASWTYTPSANSPEGHEIVLVTGKKSLLDSSVDRTFPYHEVSWDADVQNAHPALPPVMAFSAGVTDPSATRAISLDLSTATDCETFSDFAIKEDGSAPDATDFTGTCTVNPLQVVNYNISEPIDGPVNLKIWSRDIAGRISSSALDLSLVVDSTAPEIEIVNLQTGYSSDDTHTFEWTLSEVHSSSTQNFTVELYNGTAWVALGTEAVTDGPHDETPFSADFALPNINVSNAKIRITYSDTLGQQTVVESAAFAINRPILGSSPASVDLGSVLNKVQSAVTNFTFTNTGLVASKTCSSVVLSGTNAAEFSISSNGCNTNSIAASGSCAMGVRATPTAKGTRTATATITCGNDTYATALTIESTNNTPATAAITRTTPEETAIDINLGAITDVDGDSLTFSFPASPTSGVLDNCRVDTGNWLCRYTPNTNFAGSDSFTYRTNDGTVNSNTSTVSITVLPLNDAPTLTGPLAISTAEDTAKAFNLVAGSDVDGDTLSYVVTTGPANGTLVCPVATAVACTYTPNLNYNGTDSFVYRVTDGTLNSATVTASITVTAVNDAPLVAADQSLTTRDNFSYSFTIDPGNDVDTAQGTLTYKLISGPATGTLSNCISTGAYSSDRTCSYIAPVQFDGSVSFTYLVYDGALDSATTATITIDVNDETPTTPNLSAVNFVSTVTTSNSPLTLTAAACTDISYIMIQESSTAPTTASTGWQTCSTAAAAMTFNPATSNQQGFRTLRIYGRDANNNISTPQLINFIYDSLPPQIVLETIPTLPNGIAYPVKFRLTEASVLAAANFTLQYSLDGGTNWVAEASVPVGQDGPHASTLYTYNWNVPAGTHPNSLFRISLTDSTGQTGTVTSAAFKILVDINTPNFIAGAMKINGSTAPAPTPQKYVNVSLKAIDGDTNITHFCLKVDSSAPSVSDNCWRAVDAPQPGLVPAETLDMVNFPFLLGFVPGIYNVYAWVKDLSGNISTNSGTVGMDLVTVEYFGDNPPVLTNFIVSNTITPPNPITANEMDFDNGDQVTIKWTANDDKGIQSTIRLSYTTDDLTYTEIANSLTNGLNNCSNIDEGGTTLDDDSTGCYQWTSPVGLSQYFKVQLIVEDTASQETSVTSLPLNSSRFKVLAGNIDPGVNSSAKSAIIAAPGAPALHTLAVASDGKVFLRDASFGLMYINPRTGIFEQLLQVTGSSTGDNGPVRSATAQAVYKITMDYQDRLIIWDYDRIRRVDTKTEPMQIETIIGAYNNGAAGTQTTDTVTDPADLRVYPMTGDNILFQPLPNGDIYFQGGPGGTVDGGNTIRVYRGSLPTPTISTIRVSGNGTADDYAGQLSLTSDTVMGYNLAFDVNTSALTKIMVKLMRYPVGCSFYSMASVDLTSFVSTPPHPPAHVSTCGDYASRTANDGQTYHFNNGVAWPIKVSRYDVATNSNVPVLGSGAQGFCSDGTLATACNTNLSDVFVTSTGKVFFLDNGLVRVIDDTGKVQTLYGQTKTYGDYGLAQDARFNYIPYIDHGMGNDIIVYDANEKVLREIRPDETTSQVIRIAGNGQTGAIDFTMQATMQTLNGASWGQPGTFATNPANGNVYFACTWGMICKLDRGTGLWELYAGQGTLGTHWLAPGDVLRSDIRLGGYTPTILSNYAGRMVTGTYEWSGTTNMNSGLRELNTATEMSTFLAGKAELDGATGCPDGQGDGCNLAAARSEGHAMTYHTGLNVWLYEQGGNVLRELSVDSTYGRIQTFATLPDAVSSMVWNGSTLYYCSDSGLLNKVTFSPLTVTNLPFPSTAIRCYGMNILFKNASGSKPNRLVFPFRQNGLSGVGEYLNP